MIKSLSRRLLIRDNGSRESNKIVTLKDFESEDAIIILGDPGMGKTTLFRDASNGNYKTVRNFLIDPNGINKDETIYLDALDEYRTNAGAQNVDELVKVLCSLQKPKFRLSCRAADWFGSIDQEALKVASSSYRLVVLELLPLSQEEILNAVQEIVSDPVEFLIEAKSAGLADLLGNPQTLELIARAWGSDKKPQNKFQAYEVGVSELVKEMNEHHVPRGVPNHNLGDLLEAAGAIASVILLSNSVGISRVESSDDNGYIRFSDIPYTNSGSLDAALKRRLFTSSESDRLEPVHRTIAEFLAAKDLSNRILNKSLTIERVMELLCGIDGRPVSSLRGLFAWLMCMVGDLAEYYVERDPYSVATYGDASVLPPTAQIAIWSGFQKIKDPWFLKKQEDRSSFRGLANLNTAEVIHDLLKDNATGVHLKIAVLEAIANSTENIGIEEILRDMVLEKDKNTWLRSTALKAFARSVQNDWSQLELLDNDLACSSDDPTASVVRVELLLLTRTFGDLALRMLLIMKQEASASRQQAVYGYFYPLLDLPSDSDLDKILDGASQIFTKNNRYFELRLLFEKWLELRLENPKPITPVQLANWLQYIGFSSDQASRNSLLSLKKRFEKEVSLFENVFEQFVNAVSRDDRAFRCFLYHDLQKLLPKTAWPIPQCEFFLVCAKNSKIVEQGAEYFRAYVSCFPEDAHSSLAEAGFDLLESRPDIEEALGNWKSNSIEEWRKEQWDWRNQETEQRAKNIESLMPCLSSITEGRAERILARAAQIFLGFSYINKDCSDAHARLVSKTNEEIADAFIEGFMRYLDNSNIPSREEIIESYIENSIPDTHELLALSTYLRFINNIEIPDIALSSCVGIAVNAFYADLGDKLPNYSETLFGWLYEVVYHNPDVVKSVLSEMWILGARKKKGSSLPGFYKLSENPETQQFLAELSTEVLKSGINEDHVTVKALMQFLLRFDKENVLQISETEFSRKELSDEVRAIWATTLFLIEPSEYLESWKELMGKSDTVLWQAIELLQCNHYNNKEAILITPAQRAEVITLVGHSFPNVGWPSSSTCGSQNPWNASEFVRDQISLLAASSSENTDEQFERLETDNCLNSYHDWIKHYRVQYQSKLREIIFTFASPEKVAESIQNRAPVTPSDLLAFIVYHLSALEREMARTQRERYRVFWNHDGRDVIKPKYEIICSKFLAEDLQNRVRAQGLIVTVEHHMVADKKCDIVVMQGNERLLPIEVKHHYHQELWSAWRTQLDHLYTLDISANRLGIYLVLWSGEDEQRRIPTPPEGVQRPINALELKSAIETLIPERDQQRLKVVVVDISGQ